MKRTGIRVIIACLVAAAWSAAPGADVKTQERSAVKFEGMLGRMAGLFGGKGAREGFVNSVAVRQNRKMTLNEYNGQIIDLDEQKIYDLDVRQKTYRVTTFDELRRRLQDAQAKAREASQKEGAAPPAGPGAKEFEVDFDLKESGQTRTISGYSTREVVMTITVREKGKTLQEAGGMVLTANSWLGPRIPAMKEIMDFDLRFLRAIGEGFAAGSAEQMAAAMAMFPGLKEALARLRTENVNLDGTAILTTVTVQAVPPPQQSAQAEESPPQRPAGVGGLIGGLGRRIAQRKEAKTDGGRTTIMTMTHELLSVSSSAGPADVAIPAGFQEQK